VKIKDAIKQNKDFKDNCHEAMVNLHFTSGWLTQMNSKIVEPHNLSMQQYNVLRILRGQHPKSVTVKFIIERMLDKSSNASRLVDKLLAKGLVERTQSPEDRRRVDIMISKKGLELLKKLAVDFDNVNKSLNLTEKEARSLSDLLDKMRS
jgi:DNA-binding MarR family transcriptional regulator